MLNNQVAALLLCGIFAVNAQRKDVCTTRTCNKTAHQFLENMDSTVNPCTDFYEFACGSFLKNTVIPNDEMTVDIFSTIQSHVNQQVKELFNKHSDSKNRKLSKNLKIYYDLCTDEAELNARGVETAVDILRKAGGWPILGKQWKEDKWSYLNTEIWLQSMLAEQGLINVFVGPNIRDKSKRIIYIDQPDLIIPRVYLVKGFGDDVVEIIQKLLVDVAVAFGVNRQVALSEQKETVNFAISLAKITTKEEDRRDLNRMFNLVSVAALKQWAWMDWTRLFNGILPRGISLSETDQVVVAEPDYLTKLGHLLKQFPARMVANYMLSKTAFKMYSQLPMNVKDSVHRLDSGKETSSSLRGESCMNAIKAGPLSVALSSLYVQNYLNKEYKKKATYIVTNIKKEMLKILQEVTWMDKKTKKLAKKKASRTLTVIGYPPELLNDHKLQLYYKGVRMNESSYLEAMFDLARWQRETTWLQLRQRVSRQSDWPDQATRITKANAVYMANSNSIELPASILQPPFLEKLPDYLTLASMGSIIGHEFTHGFDDVGRQFDDKGNLKNWWSKESSEKFNKRKQCIIDQYSSFNDTKQTYLKVNGINVQGEAIADNGGLKLAYRLFKGQGKRHQPSLPGLERYTTQQLFFISYANFWCAKSTDKGMMNTIRTDKHPPPEFRLKGALQNFKPFSKAFSCSVGSEMNPEKKCQVW